MALFLCEYICWCPWFLPPCIRCWRKCLTKTNFLFMHCKKKKKEKKAPVLGMLYFSIFRLCAQTDHKAFIPTGNQLQLFLCQFSPTPQFRWTCSPTEPTMKDLSSFSLSTSDIFFFFFFWLLPLCRRHAAYANTRSFMRETPPLNECSLKWGHTHTRLHRGQGTCTNYNRWICMPTLTRPQSNIKRSAAEGRRHRSTWFTGVTVYHPKVWESGRMW